MEFKNLNLKDIKQFKGENILDLAEPTLVINANSKYFVVKKLFLVTDDYVMRPDLISFAVYGSADYVDIILKANEISNPFSINSGDVLLIINKDEAQNFYKTPKKQKADIDDTKALFINPDRASVKDITRIKRLQAKANSKSNGSSEVKPTNLKRDGEDTFTFDGGAIKLSDYKSKKL
jgi:hypothetical protein